MEFLPIFLDIRDRKCVVVGGGQIALRKALLLARAGARLQIVCENVSAALTEFGNANPVEFSTEGFNSSHLEDAALVIAATDNPEVNRLISAAARERDILVNVVDQPALCTFILPSVVDRSPVVIAVSSSGNSPVLTRKLKELNEVMLPERIGEFAEILGSFRERVKSQIGKFSDRVRYWESLLESDIPELVYSGNSSAAIKRIEESLLQFGQESAVGEVYLVGAGPGDPDLLTLRALRLMHKADVVLYDRLVSEQIMNRLRPDAEKIHVGKARAKHTVEQETINQMLVRLAREGKKVLRLKGGDPFIFGRGGEELETLAREKVSFQVVPGITAASGCASYAGIPLTHRDYSQSVRFLAGHLADGELNLDWESLVKEQQTLVFYMGLLGLETICNELVDHGMDPLMPIAVIQQGTTSNQKVITSTLSAMPAEATRQKLVAPTIIIIGQVVKLREQLSWFEGRIEIE
ncbi:MAG: siroheme synthase CysG [Proteobacteria bacterium]|nr:siroheme synthase CysG [Pseudomonadota bacterium]